MEKHTCNCSFNVDFDSNKSRILLCPLHAAAPEMLETLKDLQRAAKRVIENWDSGNLAAAVNELDGVQDDARAAIAKAEGK